LPADAAITRALSSAVSCSNLERAAFLEGGGELKVFELGQTSAPVISDRVRLLSIGV
jgi:hypothetical protein